eukprot:gene2530-2569_t
MDWMTAHVDRRADPLVLWPDVKSIIMLGMNYGPETYDEPAPDAGNISVYARHRDYHDVIKGKLKQLAGWLVAYQGGDVKVFVDTAPVMEKPLAQAAGLGWQGKHTNLVSKDFGSWLFLGSIFTTLALEPDTPEPDHCGSCRACLDACPTDAFPAPYTIDARRCISYLTIEHKGAIDVEFRDKIGNRIYGCDACLAACPWNKFAKTAREMKLQARADLRAPPLVELATLDDAAFRAKFSGSPVKRIGRDRFIRNVLIAIGNSGDASLLPAVEARLSDAAPLVRAMAVWALIKLSKARAIALRAQNLHEQNEDVQAEWAALNGIVEKQAALQAQGVDVLLFNAPEVEAAISKADVLLVSAPPREFDPVLRDFAAAIARSKARKIIYLSTIGVYGNQDGGWVDETTPPEPYSERSAMRAKVEQQWLNLGVDHNKNVQILRLAGIYGPGQNALQNLKSGTARRIIKPGQVFNRIHVGDIGRAILAAMKTDLPSGIFNVTDDEPAPPQDVIAYAAQLLGMVPPPGQDFATAKMSEMARSFYSKNQRVSNRRLHDILKVELAYPTYREGIKALFEQGEGR